MGYFIDAFKALFTRNTTNAASVSGARVPIVQEDGTPIGNDSLANLASVLCEENILTIGPVPANGSVYTELKKGVFVLWNSSRGGSGVFACTNTGVAELQADANLKLTCSLETVDDVKMIKVTNTEANQSHAKVSIKWYL